MPSVNGTTTCELDGRAAANEPANEPCERLRRDGVETLGDRELVEIVAGAAFARGLVLDAEASKATADEWLERARGGEVSVQAAARLAAAFELGRRIERVRRHAAAHERIDGPSAAMRWFEPFFRGERQETFATLLLDVRGRVRKLLPLTRGTLTSSLVHPREVFGPAVREGAAALIVAHNHPSGDPEPSPEDFAVTERLVKAGEVLGIALVDHLVVAGALCRSLRRDSGLWQRRDLAGEDELRST
jgi:DNA repair protein RadC